MQWRTMVLQNVNYKKNDMKDFDMRTFREAIINEFKNCGDDISNTKTLYVSRDKYKK